MKNIIRQFRRARAAFTLMEVNLAIFIMAVGVLTMTSLYPLGFRESQQARDDVEAAVVADEVLGKLTAALSSRNITWDTWRRRVDGAVNKCPNGWFAYFKQGNNNTFVPVSKSQANSRAAEVFTSLATAATGYTQTPTWLPDTDYAYGIVAQWGKRIIAGVAQNDYSRVSISFRMARRSGALMTAPIYYTEVHFQGDQKDMEQ